MTTIPIDEKFITDACYYAFRTVKCSFDENMKPKFGNGGLFTHLLGKVGEMAFYNYCMQNDIAVKHTPFRNDYSRLDGRDDFIISIIGHDFRVEVKTSSFKDFSKINENTRVFYNREQYKAQEDKSYLVVFAAVNHTVTDVKLLGWIHAEDIRKHPIWKNRMQSPAYAIPVKALRPMELLRDDGVWGQG